MKSEAMNSDAGSSGQKSKKKSEYLKHLEKRSKLQRLTWFGLPIVAGGGWIYPPLGYLMLGCMGASLGIAAFRGRAWCDWMCPRGAFLDLFLKRSKHRRRVPKFLHSWWTRAFMMAFMMTVMGVQVYRHWGDWSAVGLVFTMILTVTTLLAIIIGIAFKERSWCMICPMGTMSALISTNKEPLSISSACNDCGACWNVCPMEIRPSAYRDLGTVGDNDCLKCRSCVVVCPKKALSFE